MTEGQGTSKARAPNVAVTSTNSKSLNFQKWSFHRYHSKLNYQAEGDIFITEVKKPVNWSGQFVLRPDSMAEVAGLNIQPSTLEQDFGLGSIENVQAGLLEPHVKSCFGTQLMSIGCGGLFSYLKGTM